MSRPFEFDATVERHHPQMPPYLLVPPRFAQRLMRAETSVADATVNGVSFGRRTLKP